MKRKLQNLMWHFGWYERRMTLRRLQEVTDPFALMRETFSYCTGHCAMAKSK